MRYSIRPIQNEELHLLEDFLYGAIFQRDTEHPLPREVIFEPALYVYIENFGKADDHCLVAESDNQVIGAVWVRILGGSVKGFGHIDSRTPEFAISVKKGYQKLGIGTALMNAMLDLLKAKGYEKTSLAVQKDNYAVKMYLAVGFSIIDELDEEYLMVYDLRKR